VRAFPDRGLLPGISCAKNLGPAALETVQAQATKKTQSLPPRSRVVAWIGGLHTVGLGFEQSILVVELGTGNQKWVPAENLGGATLRPILISAFNSRRVVSPPPPRKA
jgi:hypothetical protein